MMNHELLSWLLTGKREASTDSPGPMGPTVALEGPYPYGPEQKANTHTHTAEHTHTHIYIYIYMCVYT